MARKPTASDHVTVYRDAKGAEVAVERCENCEGLGCEDCAGLGFRRVAAANDHHQNTTERARR